MYKYSCRTEDDENLSFCCDTYDECYNGGMTDWAFCSHMAEEAPWTFFGCGFDEEVCPGQQVVELDSQHPTFEFKFANDTRFSKNKFCAYSFFVNDKNKNIEI